MKLNYISCDKIINNLLISKQNIKDKADLTYLIIFFSNIFHDKLFIKLDLQNFWGFMKKISLKYINIKINFLINKKWELKYNIFYLIELLLLEFDLPQFFKLLIEKKIIREEFLNLMNKLILIINDLSLQIPSFELSFNVYNEYKKSISSDKIDNCNLYSENKFENPLSFINYYENYFNNLSKIIFNNKNKVKYNIFWQMEKCYSCNKNLRNLFIYKNYEYCMFTNKFYCKSCMFKDKLRIPYQIVKYSDLNKYKISNKGEYDLKRFNKLVAIKIKNENVFINNYKEFFLFFLLKKKIIIQFLQICDFNIIVKNLPKRENIFVKNHYFNLQDIDDILDLSLVKLMNQTYYNIYKHFLNCNICKKLGSKCNICGVNNLYKFDIENNISCQICKKWVHISCSNNLICLTCN